MANNRNNEGVSATIGVILIVLITVILAALIAEFGLQMGNEMPKQHIVGARIERTDPAIITIKTIGGDLNFIKSGGIDNHVQAEATYTCMVNGVQAFPVTAAGDPIPDDTGNFDASSIGGLMYFPANHNDDITVIAQFTDETSSFIFSGKIP